MNTFDETRPETKKNPTLKTTCLALCNKIITQVQKVKHALLTEYIARMDGQKRALWRALNEAEVLAWQTGFPHLVFPVLATEKMEALAERRENLGAIRGTGAAWAFAS